MKYNKLGIVADQSESSQECKKHLMEMYNLVDLQAESRSPASSKVDALVAIGGDGFMLHTLHNHIKDGLPVYGMNKGTMGFLLNEFSMKNLDERVNEAADSKIHPLRMICECENGEKIEALAINEVSLLRTTGQAAKISINVDNSNYLREMICDGVLVSTPAGSSAYNYSNGGMILPIKSNLLPLTPISPFRPRLA